MNPGDVYNPPGGHRQQDPYADPYAQPAPYPPAGYTPEPQGDPFADTRYGAPTPQPPPVPRPPTVPAGYDQRPPTAHDPYDPGLQPPGGFNDPLLNRVESNASFNQPYGLHDERLTSPPPMMHSHSHSNYPPSGQYQPHGQYQPDDDAVDSAPLLSNSYAHAYPDPSFGVTANYNPVMPGGYDNPPPRPGAVRFDQPYGDGGLHDPDQPISNVHYGPVPQRVIRRNKTTKRVPLFLGHLVVDVDVPKMLLDKCPIKEGNEFTKMRYTAITCDPNDFKDDRYTLRQKLYKEDRHTELFIDDVLFCRTMRGIMLNVQHLCNRGKTSSWNKEGWKKVVIAIVSDGRLKINKRTLAVISALGCYQDGVAKNVVNGKPVTAHLYEYTTQMSINSKGMVTPGDSKAVPVQLLFCLKEKNQKKLNSHRWFFNAFGEVLKPTYCVLLDVGTEPGSDSIYHIWKTFDRFPNCGGACGEIVALKGKFGQNLINPLVAAQNFEYKMSNILDKPLESILGYITVLPGAFSAYRYIALQNDEKGEGPLEKYFYGEKMHGAGAGIFKANMYLAEDRILCWELVSKRDARWTLHYTKSAYAHTDVPEKLPELVSQRRRWLNGSFFAAIHSIVHFSYIYRSSHTLARKFWLHVELVYQVINNVFGWFSLGNFYIVFIVLTKSMEDLAGFYKYINIVLQYMYLALLVVCFVLSLGNRPQGSNVGYTISMVGFAVITIYMLVCAVILAIKGFQEVLIDKTSVKELAQNTTFVNMIMSLLATYGLYIVASLLAFDPWHMVTSFVQYLLIAPSYINVLNVYAFSNVHDVSWGTKGSDKVSDDLGVVKSDSKDEVEVEEFEERDTDAWYANELQTLAKPPPKEVTVVSEEQSQEDYYKNFRTNVLLAWVITNAALACGILQPGGTLPALYVKYVLYVVVGLSFFRFCGSTAYLIVRMFKGE